MSGGYEVFNVNEDISPGRLPDPRAPVHQRLSNNTSVEYMLSRLRLRFADYTADVDARSRSGGLTGLGYEGRGD